MRVGLNAPNSAAHATECLAHLALQQPSTRPIESDCRQVGKKLQKISLTPGWYYTAEPDLLKKPCCPDSLLPRRFGAVRCWEVGRAVSTSWTPRKTPGADAG
jgi:hypothetical protein